ncbi:type II toxin-antitoxin system VapC family toxin [bacterium]|nr:type II toxin-antitoxin system VapC family toxin [bacterium]
MNYLLDTCVISELIKLNPSTKVCSWISEIEEDRLFLSVLTIGEIYKGIEKLPDSRKKEGLSDWINSDLINRFQNRIIVFDQQVATIWGKIQAYSEKVGKTMPTIDGQIAATGICCDLTVVTRNTSDMKISGVSLYDPW